MSPRTKEQNEEIRNQRMQEILQAAIHVYAEKGFAASEIGEVAERAGLARGLVYHYFKNKQTLFRELYEYMMEKTQCFTKSHFEQEDSTLPLFSEYARMVCKQVLDEPHVSRFYMRISMDVHYLYTAEQFSPFEWVKSFMKPMAQAIEKGINQKTIRQGNANLMAMQFWGAISQGMNYLDKLQQDLLSQGASELETKEQLETNLEQVIESAVGVLKPE
ncbi:TetR/AcrR family transcriptional regulator [Bacillus swezeyi]|uniref:TetR family transcriptional regulator n=1 Tax=Bacillus swezeyi TaxID=1925020 RepID=A0A1R1RMW7_9BACI|nr:TetR/AcrR family transcriptional regulator [Bacillus swezeyi]MEC1261317.1 TetR/AcrR family transcriptional regulator [Bacillus swezeyi]MED2929212.1 TetR/AcrR family transcriptional regulator [Bacillus swezeyi]MED2941015.1 TetR/AcrR family transcriptional regulator [Bacillus swezeyi]MED2963761.1 TetR/AcrR family transcriptional regulator [Bacillus swezeyi]MED2975509.1 TetR/AcrR family transcriptional regulator [Bacillus swezeyi]